MSLVKIIKCTSKGCNETFNHRMILKRHLDNGKCTGVRKQKRFIRNENGHYVCQKCHIIVKQHNNTTRHLKLCSKDAGVFQANKNGRGEYQCSLCDKTCPYQSYLKRHIKTHEKGSTKICHKCGKSFRLDKTLEKHTSQCIIPSMTHDMPNIDTALRNENAIMIISTPTKNVITAEVQIVQTPSREQSTYTLLKTPSREQTTYTSVATQTPTKEVCYQSDSDLDFTVDRSSTSLDNLGFPQSEPGSQCYDSDSSVVVVDHLQLDSSNPIVEARRKKQLRESKRRSRLSFNINNMLNDVEEQEKTKVMMSAIAKSDPHMTNFLSSTLNYFRDLIRNARRSITAKIGAKSLRRFLGPSVDDTDTQLWLTNVLGLSDTNELSTFLPYAEASLDDIPRGRPMLDIEVRQQIYNFWILNSEISIHRSNNRHIIKIDDKNIKDNVKNMHDSNIKPVIDEEGRAKSKSQAHRQIALHPYRKLFETYCKVYKSTVSFSSFVQHKPFYISPPTQTEMEMCMCTSCLNPHCLYSAIRKRVNIPLPYSLTEFLCCNMKCAKEELISINHLDCITGKCKNKCKIVDIKQHILKESIPTEEKSLLSYYVFERVDTNYFNKQGKVCIYKRTTRVDKKDTLENIIDHLQLLAQKYLVHRFMVNNDDFYWKKFLQDCPFYVLWLDYSQNISLTEKYQVQSAHYSGKQQTLHNTLLHSPRNENSKYIYHISDDTNHDSIFTFSVIEDVIAKHPEVIASGILVIRSDNCEEQYKNKKTFYLMKLLAAKYNITFVWFYGIPGHGRGLVDAMSSFGVKQPIKHVIITKDVWFPSADSMVSFLKKHFQEEGDNTKEYNLILEEFNAKIRAQKQGEHVLKPCRCYHMIAVDPEGCFTKELYIRNIDLQKFGTQANSQVNAISVDIEDDIFSDEQFEIDEASHNNDVIFELAEPGTFIGLRSPPNSIEQFFLAEVITKDTADENIQDTYGHCILAGESYLDVKYLQQVSGKVGRKVKYIQPKDECALIHVAEVFITNIELNNLELSSDEYRSILEAL